MPEQRYNSTKTTISVIIQWVLVAAAIMYAVAH
jgi:hypothetical protein